MLGRCSTSIFSARSDGFTLLEMIVAITVLGLIFTVAFGAVRMGGKSWETGLIRTKENTEKRFITEFLRRSLSQAIILEWTKRTGNNISFEGKVDRVRYLAPAPKGRNKAGMYEYSLEVEWQEEGYLLVLYYEPFLPGVDKFQVTKNSPSKILLRKLDRVSFQYFGSGSNKRLPKWSDTWISTYKNLPIIMRIEIDSKSDRYQWPVLNFKFGINS